MQLLMAGAIYCRYRAYFQMVINGRPLVVLPAVNSNFHA